MSGWFSHEVAHVCTHAHAHTHTDRLVIPDAFRAVLPEMEERLVHPTWIVDDVSVISGQEQSGPLTLMPQMLREELQHRGDHIVCTLYNSVTLMLRTQLYLHKTGIL